MLYSKQEWLKTREEMSQIFSDIPEALANTMEILDKVEVYSLNHDPIMPFFPIPEEFGTEEDVRRRYTEKQLYDEFTSDENGKNQLSPEEGEKRIAHLGGYDRIYRIKFEAEYLGKLAYDGAKKLYGEPLSDEVKERINFELHVMKTMGFPGYFLIVMEFIQWSKDHGVPVGPGRGSGGGSLVAYALTITDFDPLRFDLFFERFLNPERVSMPDFDVDFCQRKRYLTLQHVVDHYRRPDGQVSVSQIAAFGTLAPKAAIQGVGRAIGVPLGQVRRVAGLIPETPGTTFNACFGLDKKGKPITDPKDIVAPDFIQFYNQAKLNDDKESVELINVSARLEGVIRSIGKHAAGVVISPTRISEFSPIMLDSDGKPITQYDKKDVEHAGLVKFDFLGLTTLTIIDDAKTMIDAKLAREGKPPINIAAIPYDDEESFKMIQETETTAVFQLESTGMRKLIGRMQPDRFDDLVALVALYRPGPLESGMVDHFVNRKHGLEEVSYPLPEAQDLDLKPILDSTYGVIVYQEQVMQLAQVLAGYTLGGADILRRAMGKKIPSEMAAQLDVFIQGAKKKNKDIAVMKQIFDQVQKFAAYGFNKSHSAAYALVAWWTLYLKVHYPAEFLAAMMTADCMKTEKLISYIGECHRLGVDVNPPDVNSGKFYFGVDLKGNVIYGFSAIKGVGENLVNHIVEEREKNGLYSDFFDFVYRVGTNYLSRGTLEALIKSGALDSIGPSRSKMLASIQRALDYAKQKTGNEESGQGDLFAMLEAVDTKVRPEYVNERTWSDKVRLFHEKQLLGLYLSGHPIDPYKAELIHYCGDTTINNMIPGTMDQPNAVTLGGVVINAMQRLSSKDGNKFYAITLDDGTGTFEFLLFGKNAERFAEIEKLSSDKSAKAKKSDEIPSPLILIVSGMLTMSDEGQMRLRIKELNTLEGLRVYNARKITLNFTQKMLDENINEIEELVMRNRISVKEVNAILRHTNEPETVVKGCTVSMIIGNMLLRLRDDSFRVIPSDDLIEGLMDICGSKSVHVSY